MVFDGALVVIATVAGAVAAIAGFGIGSLLTPLLALRTGTKVAVAAISLTHLVGTAVRLWMMWRHVDRGLLWNFGIASGVFGLLGALIHAYLSSHVLSWIFGGLLVLAGASTLTGVMEKFRPGRKTAWTAGGLSGVLGGLVGNQGGVRTAALLGFNVPRDGFVATATAIALMVDFGRVPVYLVTDWSSLKQQWLSILLALLGVVAGTILGARVLGRIPEKMFHRVVAVLVIALGVYMILRG